MSLRFLRWKELVAGDDQFHLSRNRMDASYVYPMHTHDFAEIFYIIEGSGTHQVNGARRSLTAGDLVMVRPSDRHGFDVKGDGFLITNLAFPLSALQILQKRYRDIDASFLDSKNNLPLHRNIDPLLRPAIENGYNEMAPSVKSRMELDRFLLNLFHLCAHADTSVYIRQDWLENACRRLKEEEFILEGTSRFVKECGRSPEHVARVVRQQFACTPTDLVNRARAQYAAAQLTLTSKKILAIALDSGFGNLGNFYQVFRRHYDVTPRQYRLKNSAPFSVR